MPKQLRKKKSGRVGGWKKRQGLDKDVEAMLNPGILKPPRRGRHGNDDEDNSDDETKDTPYLPPSLSQKVLQQARAQQEEENLEATQRPTPYDSTTSGQRRRAAQRSAQRMSVKRLDADDPDDDEELFEPEGDDDGPEDIVLSAEDERALQMFMPTEVPVRRTLADLIMEKINAHEATQTAMRAAQETGPATAQPAQLGLPAHVVETYTQVGQYLSRYTSGKIPKAFKIIPALQQWEEVLYLTAPEKWTPQAMFVATRLFASNLNPKMAQRYYNLVLLPRVLNNIDTYKKLNYHLYQSVKKSIYKPAAFFRGILLPLAEEGCTLRQSMIIASILAKCSIPAVHSGVALLKLAEMPFSGTTCLFMKTLLNKKYSLPVRVVQAMVRYFCSFAQDPRTLPVVWHQNLLTFVQRYKHDLTDVQKSRLKALMRAKPHHQITGEVRRELLAPRPLSVTEQLEMAKAGHLPSDSGFGMPAPMPLFLQQGGAPRPSAPTGMDVDIK